VTAGKEKRVVLRGLGASPGQALGPAFVIASAESRVPAHPVAEERLEAEIRELHGALRAAREEIRALRDGFGGSTEDPAHQILGSHLMILQDRELIDEVVAAIRRERMNAAYIVQQTFQAKARYLESLPSELFRARAADIRDVQGRLLGHLLGCAGASLNRVPAGSVVVANEIAPSEAAGLDRGRVAALVVRHGTLTSHVTIMARSRGVPAVVALGEGFEGIHAGNRLLVDGTLGRVVVAPGEADLAEHERALDREQRVGALLAAFVRRPGMTRDGRSVPVLANLDRPEDVNAALAAGAEGIGLYRTETLFLEAGGLPREEAQAAAYRSVIDAFAGRTVTIRTLDLGGDKYTALMGIPREENPFLGLRGIRFCLEHPEIFLTQVRAVLRHAGPGVRLLLPMIGGPEQLRAARRLIERAAGELRAEGLDVPERPPVGVMIEVPSAVLTSDILAREADYFSLGTNDLIQYCLAVDRGNARIAQLYDPLDPAVLRAVDLTVRHAHAAGIRVGSCGEMSGQLPGGLLLVGLGVDELSVTPSQVPRVRALLAHVEAEPLARLARRCLESGGPDEVRQILREALGKDPQFHLEERDGHLLFHWSPIGNGPGDPKEDG
jgi:phosphotransferase system enzyme I (PtsI)